MKAWMIVAIIWGIMWLSIWYATSHKNYPKLSAYIDTKTIHGVKPSWIVQITSTRCSWTCSNSSPSSSSSSRWSSSYWWGK